MRAYSAMRVAVLSVAMWLATSVSATTLAPTSFPEMVSQSPTIVHGTVTASESRWNDDRTLIVTDVTVTVHDALRGDSPGTVVFTQPGGQVGGLRVDVPGASAMRTGDEAVFFLAPGAGNRLYLYGLDRGRYSVLLEPNSGTKLVRGLGEDELRFLLPETKGAIRPQGRVQGGSLSLDEFKAGVQRVAAAGVPRDTDLPQDGGER